VLREASDVPGDVMGSGERRRMGTGRSGGARGILACLWVLLVAGLAVWVSVSIVDHLRGVLRAEPEGDALRAASLRFALATVGLAVASMVASAALPPVWRRRAIMAVAFLPVPVALIAGQHLLAGVVALALLLPALWLGRELGARLLGLTGLLESWVIGSAMGVGFLALLGTALARFGLLRPVVVWPLLLLVMLGLCVMAGRRLGADLAVARRWSRRPLAFRADYAAMGGVALGFFWLNLIGALAPELYADAVVYRLPVSALIARTGRFTVDPDLPISNAPRFAEVVYALVIAAGPLQATKLIELSVGLLCTAGVGLVAKRLAGARAAAMAAIVFYTLPLTAQLSQTAYTDLFATHFAVTAAALLVRRERLAWRAVLGALLALAAGMSVKPSFAITAAGLALALVALLPWRRRMLAGGAAAALVGAALLALFALSPPGRQQVRFVLHNVAALNAFGTERSVAAFVASPVNVIRNTAQYGAGEYQDGFAGYALLALVPLVALVRPARRVVALLVAAAVAYGLWFLLAQYLRYALPGFALQCAIAGAAYAAVLARGGPGTRHVLAILTTGLIALSLPAWLNTSLLQQGAIPYRVALGQQSRAAYLSEHLAGFAILDLYNRQPDATRVLSTHNYAQLYSATGLAVVEGAAISRTGTEQEVLAFLDRGGFSHIIVDRTVMPRDWDRYLAVDEAFLRRNAVLIGGERNAYLYRLVPPEQRGRDQGWARGPELLPNGGMEEANGDRPAGWTPFGRPGYDRTGSRAETGQAAFRATPQDWYTATVPVQPQGQYLLAHATRAEGEAGLARLQVNWLDATDQLVGVAIEVVPTSPRRYVRFSMLATAPPGASKARIYLTAQQGSAWFDAASFRAVSAEAGLLAGVGRAPGSEAPPVREGHRAWRRELGVLPFGVRVG
jgi:hypothetical protein